MKRFLILAGCFLGAVFLGYGLPAMIKQNADPLYASRQNEESIISQRILAANLDAQTVYKVYDAGELIGILSSKAKLNPFLEQVYRKFYAQDFPHSKAALGKDVYIAPTQSYFSYEDKDDAILDYIQEKRLFTLRATAVEFRDDNGVYAQIYVSDEALYNEAMQSFLNLFVSKEDLSALANGKLTPQLNTYGSRITGVSITQTVTTKEAYAPPEAIKKDVTSILDYLEYGDNTERAYYTVEKYDTVAGVGTKNNGLSATQVMNLNRDKITSVDQILTEGDQLCITYFTSPIDVVVTVESMRQENIYPQTIYQEDSSLRKGASLVKQTGVNGAKNTVYAERWINGVLISGSPVSSVDTLQPVDEIIAVGTLEIPGIGTGSYRWPVDNVHISCRWGCYFGHYAVDVQNYYDRYGVIRAADRGVVEVNSYNSVNGNYVIINHNNGFHSYYGHMNVKSPLEVGTIVDKGEVIGQIGMTGRATGPHVHFFIYEGETAQDIGKRHNPCEFLDCDATI